MKARKLGALLLGAMLTVASLTGCSASGQTTSGAEAQATAENGYGLEEFVMVMILGRTRKNPCSCGITWPRR